MKRLTLFLLLLSFQVLNAAPGKVWLVRCARQSDDGQAIKDNLKSKAINVLNVIEKEDLTQFCGAEEKIQAFYFWQADKERAKEAEPSLKNAPEGFNPHLPKRVH